MRMKATAAGFRHVVRAALAVAVLWGVACNAPAPQRGELDASRARWNEIFSSTQPVFNTAPNAFLVRCLDRLPRRGEALDIAMGQGRNAVRLAEHGLETTGIDISDVAIDAAVRSARDAGVSIHAQRADVFSHKYGRDRWDVISIIYFNPAKSILDRIKEAVKPGGFIVIEGFGNRKVGGPPDDSKYGPNELLRIFNDWHVLAYEDGEFEADWSGRGTQHVVRMLAQRPLSQPAAPSRARP